MAHDDQLNRKMNNWKLYTTSFVILIALTFISWVILSGSILDAKDPMVDYSHEITFTVYDQGKPIKTGTLTVVSPILKDIKDTVKSRSGKWERSYASYAPGLHFSGNGFTMVLQEKKMIINYTDSTGAPVQVVTELPTDIYPTLRNKLISAK
jgi:hypothetical protein